MTSKCINLGAGDKPRPPPWENYDLPDFDVTQDRWPIKDASVDHVNADCLLAHIAPPAYGQPDGFQHFMTELARVMKPGAVFTFTAPDWRDPANALTDVCHYRLIGPRTFYHFTVKVHNRPLGAGGLWFHALTHKRIKKSYLLQWELHRNQETFRA